MTPNSSHIREEMNKRKAERDAANTPWPIAPNPRPEPSAPGAPWPEYRGDIPQAAPMPGKAAAADPGEISERFREFGTRELFRCALPNISAERHETERATLESRLIDLAGGFTSYAMAGAWRDPSGDVAIEDGIIYEVSFDPTAERSWAAARAIRAAFVLAGKAIGEHWIHIERHQFRALHTNARLF